jgi:hypothetical protein
MVSAKYGQTLLSNAYPSNVLLNMPSYREYYFGGASCSGVCPSDYGLLVDRSRIPAGTIGGDFGSMNNTSVYLYSSKTLQAARTDEAWSAYVADEPLIDAVMGATAIQDRDLSLMYKKGPNYSVFFYSSAKITNMATNTYFSVHRNFPGIVKDQADYGMLISSLSLNLYANIFTLSQLVC